MLYEVITWGTGLDTVIFEADSRLELMGYGAFENNPLLAMVFPDVAKPPYVLDYWKNTSTEASYAAGDAVPGFSTEYEARLKLAPGNSHVITSYSIHYTKLYEVIGHPFLTYRAPIPLGP